VIGHAAAKIERVFRVSGSAGGTVAAVPMVDGVIAGTRYRVKTERAKGISTPKGRGRGDQTAIDYRR
jgi:hypothetical protein